MGPGDLHAILAGLPRPLDAAVLVGTETGDDAGVYALDADRAIVCTADFITPVVDDPYRFGQVAAANSLSDVFAMGGRPLAALALCAFPKELDPDVAREILRGGQDKVIEAGAAIVGGHTVRNAELLYGLSVTGIVDPKKILRNVGARPGDALVLTKALGTGLVINGRRKGLGSDEDLEVALLSMELLNRGAAEAAVRFGAHACTDITGFGLAGHALGMAIGSGVGVVVHAEHLPLLPGVLARIREGVSTGSTRSNRSSCAPRLKTATALSTEMDQIVHDPQTSGGLLIAVAAERADELVAACLAAGAARTSRIGDVVATSEPFLEIRGAPNL
ncbi:MAG: selenide, water dikinase SelD [Myxococcales bacterium]|nr:selenide, water dikinase SelD [Myxococcales bacterium]